jgi:cell division protein FtsQ
MNATLRRPARPREPVAAAYSWRQRAMAIGGRAAWMLALGLLLAALLVWASRSSVFAIRDIRVEGELARSSLMTLRANALPRLQGNFFSLDLAQAKAAFETAPWVREAVVHKAWPAQLRVQIREHEAAALWSDEEGQEKLVNSFGEVFEANVGDVGDQALPSFSGPLAQASQMLAVYRALQPMFAKLGLEIESLRVSGRGSWRAEFDSGAVIELGRGSEEELAQRAGRFVRTVSQLTGRYGQPIQYADLRHSGGYALKLKNVTTTLMAPTGPGVPGN